NGRRESRQLLRSQPGRERHGRQRGGLPDRCPGVRDRVEQWFGGGAIRVHPKPPNLFTVSYLRVFTAAWLHRWHLLGGEPSTGGDRRLSVRRHWQRDTLRSGHERARQDSATVLLQFR